MSLLFSHFRPIPADEVELLQRLGLQDDKIARFIAFYPSERGGFGGVAEAWTVIKSGRGRYDEMIETVEADFTARLGRKFRGDKELVELWRVVGTGEMKRMRRSRLARPRIYLLACRC
jgi:hypothetical protein